MSKIYGLYDKRSRRVVKVFLSENDIIAYQECSDLIQQNRLSQPNLSMSDFGVLYFADIDATSNSPKVESNGTYEIGYDYVVSYLKGNPLEIKLKSEV